MYGYENTLEYMPANEGVMDSIKEWAKKVGAMIIEAGREIKMHMSNIFASLKASRASAADAVKASSEASSIINKLESEIEALINSCINNINTLQNHYTEITGAAKRRELKDANPDLDDDMLDLQASTDPSVKRTGQYTHKKGMGKLYEKENKLTKDDINKWNGLTNIKSELAQSFKQNADTAVKIRAQLNELTTMPLSYKVLKDGYNALKGIFIANGKFGESWNRIVIAHDWSVGPIRSYLAKVVQMYKTGVNAANALGRKLNAKKVRNDEGNFEENANRSGKTEKINAMNARKIRSDYAKSLKTQSKANTKSNTNDDYDVDDAEDAVNVDAMMESTYNDGYAQAFIDMGIDLDEIAVESAYDDGYYQAMADMGYVNE